MYMGTASVDTTGSIYWRHPRFQPTVFAGAVKGGLAASDILYSPCLLASPKQRTSPVDLWDLPRVPQWPKDLEDGVERDVNLEKLTTGDDYYSSFLGVQIRGLVFASDTAQYNFTVETTYYEIDCTSLRAGLLVNEWSTYMSNSTLNLTELFGMDSKDYGSFAATIDVPRPADGGYEYPTPIPLDDIPPATMLYATLDRSEQNWWWNHFALFNCTICPVNVHTSFTCNSSTEATNCWATRQKKVNGRYTSSNFENFIEVQGPHERSGLLWAWRDAEASLDMYEMSSTDKYLSGELYPLASKEKLKNWTDVPLEVFSKRLTTAFNTYYEASLVDSSNHTRVNFQAQPDRL